MKTSWFWLGLAGCAADGAVPAVAATDYDASAPLNPKLADGRLAYRSFGDHHPTCFAFVGESRDTETIDCPEGAVELLAECPGGRLFRHKTGDGCICQPEGEGDATLVGCATD